MTLLKAGSAKLYYSLIKKIIMKTKFLFIVCFITLTCYAINANSQANTELSNLISPTKVNQSLVPITHNSKDLVTTSTSWVNVYLGGAVYLDGKRFLSNGNDSTNVFIGADAGSKPTFFNPKTGQNNTASGQYALYSNTSGFTNTATGNSALRSNTTGNGNTATGLWRFVTTPPGNLTPLRELVHFIATKDLTIPLMEVILFIPTPPEMATPLMDLMRFVTTLPDLSTPLMDGMPFIPTPPEMATPLLEVAQAQLTTITPIALSSVMMLTKA